MVLGWWSGDQAIGGRQQTRGDDMSEKTLHNTDQNAARKNVADLVTFGGDQFKLLSKASSEAEGWMKSTKAMDIAGVGCVVQVTTQQRNPDGSYAVAEAVCFVPGVSIIAEYANADFDPEDEFDDPGDVIGRRVMMGLVL